VGKEWDGDGDIRVKRRRIEHLLEKALPWYSEASTIVAAYHALLLRERVKFVSCKGEEKQKGREKEVLDVRIKFTADGTGRCCIRQLACSAVLSVNPGGAKRQRKERR